MGAFTVISSSPAETADLGKRIAGRLRPGDVVSIIGELGAGKTVFVQGMAAGLGIDAKAVTSPTFALLNEYTAAVPLYHFDAYRIRQSQEWEGLGYEEYFRGRGITAIEWGNLVEDYLPRAYLQVAIGKGPQKIHERRITITEIGDGYGELMASLEQEVDHEHSGD